MVLVNVKWGKEKLELDVNPDESPLLFKSQLFAMTNVAPDRQKILAKGRTLGDDTWDYPVVDGMLFMMIGSTNPIPQPIIDNDPKENFESVKRADPSLPLGLNNLGNTCYFNSVVQVLRVLPELGKHLEIPSHDKFTSELGKVFQQLQHKSISSSLTNSIAPVGLLKALRAAYPQFAAMSHLSYEQQDADECYTTVLNSIFGIKAPNENVAVKNYFKVLSTSETSCVDDPTQPRTSRSEELFQVPCYLNKDVKFLQSGIKCGLSEEIEKRCESLNRNCQFLKTSHFERLPKYLSIQIMRFFYKGGADHTSAKILKEVKFPMKLDLFEFCTPALQAKLLPGREAIKAAEEAQLERERSEKLDEKEKVATRNEKFLPTEFQDDRGSNNSGHYELTGVISHKGRTLKSGHYVAWVKSDGRWLLCDDEHITVVDEDTVLRTAGGGDWHTAYILLYSSRQVSDVLAV